MKSLRVTRMQAAGRVLFAMALLALAAAPSGCAQADSPPASSPAVARPGRLHTLTPGTLPAFLSAFDDRRDVLRYIVVFSPT